MLLNERACSREGRASYYRRGVRNFNELFMTRTGMQIEGWKVWKVENKRGDICAVNE